MTVSTASTNMARSRAPSGPQVGHQRPPNEVGSVPNQALHETTALHRERALQDGVLANHPDEQCFQSLGLSGQRADQVLGLLHHGGQDQEADPGEQQQRAHRGHREGAAPGEPGAANDGIRGSREIDAEQRRNEQQEENGGDLGEEDQQQTDEEERDDRRAQPPAARIGHQLPLAASSSSTSSASSATRSSALLVGNCRGSAVPPAGNMPIFCFNSSSCWSALPLYS